MKLPCEHIVWYLLPTIKSELARELVKRGFNQKQVADKLSVTQASVSQYLSEKRGKKLKLPKEAQEAVKDLADKVVRGEEIALELSICNICMASRKAE